MLETYPPLTAPLRLVPYAVTPRFVGREAELATLRHGLGKSDTPRPWVLAGPLGVGTTQLALRYVERYGSEYSLIWLIECGSEIGMLRDFAALAHALDLPLAAAETDLIRCIRHARTWLERNSGWLLIFDGAEPSREWAELLPRRGGGHVLFTSTHASWPILLPPSQCSRAALAGEGRTWPHAPPEVLKVAPFTRAESVEFLLRAAATPDPAAGASPPETAPAPLDPEMADLLADALLDLPLPLELIGAVLRSGQTPPAELLARVRGFLSTVFDDDPQRALNEMHAATLACIVAIRAWDERSTTEPALRLLFVMACLADERLPLAVLRRFESDPLLAELDGGLSLARQACLITEAFPDGAARGPDPGSDAVALRLHPALRRVLFLHLREPSVPQMLEYLGLVASFDFGDSFEAYVGFLAQATHYFALVRLICEYRVSHASWRVRHLDLVAMYLEHRGATAAALQAAELMLAEIPESRLPLDDIHRYFARSGLQGASGPLLAEADEGAALPTLSSIYARIARLHLRRGDGGRAVDYARYALAHATWVFGAGSSEAAEQQRALGEVCFHFGDYRSAASAYQRAHALATPAPESARLALVECGERAAIAAEYAEHAGRGPMPSFPALQAAVLAEEAESPGPTVRRVEALFALGQFSEDAGDLATAFDVFRMAKHLADEPGFSGGPRVRAVACDRVGQVLARRRNPDAARPFFRLALIIARGDAAEQAALVRRVQLQLGEVALRAGELAEAVSSLAQSLEGYREHGLGDRPDATVARLYLALGFLALRRSEPEEAAKHASGVQALTELHPDRFSDALLGRCAHLSGAVALVHGDPVAADRWLRIAQARYQDGRGRAPLLEDRIELLLDLARSAQARGDLAEYFAQEAQARHLAGELPSGHLLYRTLRAVHPFSSAERLSKSN